MTVLPFGGRHIDNHENLAGQVPARLNNNRKLHRRLTAGKSVEWVSERPGLTRPAMALPFEPEKLLRLFEYITKGLAWHHWKTVLGQDCHIDVSTPTQAGEGSYRWLLCHRAKNRVTGNLGDGTFTYVGAQADDSPTSTAWMFAIYGGVTLSGDPDAPEQQSSVIGVMTMPKHMYERSERNLARARRLKALGLITPGDDRWRAASRGIKLPG